MTDYKAGDQVRFLANVFDDAEAPVGATGTIVEMNSAGFLVSPDETPSGSVFLYPREIEPFVPYDRATAEAIAQAFRDKDMNANATLVMRHFDTLVAPKETAVVVFTYPYQLDLVGALASAFDGTDFEYDVKEDN